jgi:hypothetical protein
MFATEKSEIDNYFVPYGLADGSCDQAAKCIKNVFDHKIIHRYSCANMCEM